MPAPVARQASATVKTDPLLAPVARAAVAATTPTASIATAKTDPLLAPAARAASTAVTSSPDTAPSSRIPSSPMVSITANSSASVEQRAPTLVGLSPPARERQPSSEDLDWEVPTNPHPSPLPDRHEGNDARPPAATHALGASAASTETEPPMVEVEELPPESHPSGIGSKYVPKDLNAPPIVLKEDVQAAEAKQRQKLEVEHRSRRAATIIRMRAPDPVPAPPVIADEDLSFPVRKSRTGLYVGAALVVLVGSVGAGMLLQRKSAEPTAAAAAATTPAPAVTPDLEAPKPAEPVAAAAEPPVAIAPEPKAEPAAAAAAEAAPEPPGPARVAAVAKPEPAPAQVAVPTRPKAKPAATPTSKPGGASPSTKPAAGASKSSGSRNVIVRDTPF